MRNITSEFKQQLENDDRKYLEYVDITLKNGTVLHLTNEHLWNYGLKFEDCVSDDSEFTIGAANINKLNLSINNIYDDFSDYDFDGAEVVVYVGKKFGGESALLDTTGDKILDSNNEEIITDSSRTEKVRICIPFSI